jgi:chemotaxis protein CheZ
MSADTNHSDVDLEALFDRIAAERVAGAAPGAGRAVAHPAGANGAVAIACASAASTPCGGAMPCGDSDACGAHMFRRIGKMTRMLHEALGELGHGRKLASVVNSMPDARKRLEYIASLTGRSAETVLEGVERAQVLQQAMEQSAFGLNGRWQAVYDGTVAADDFGALAADTREFLHAVRAKTAATQEHLHQMMMAQDFHDLTGQVIRKIVDVAHGVESSLVELLLESRPAGDAPAGWLNGPAIGADPAGETVSSQAQVDHLLDSLGF